MKEKFNEATQNRPFGDRQIDSTFVSINIPFYINTIRQEKAWQKNDRNAITVFKTDTMCIVLVAMHKDADLTYHVAECATSIQVLEGTVNFHNDETSVDMVPGEIVAVHDGYNYSLHAKEDTIILLTMCYITQKVL